MLVLLTCLLTVAWTLALHTTACQETSVSFCPTRKLCRLMSLSCVIVFININVVSQSSSLSVMPGYGLDDRAIEVRCPAEIRDFFSTRPALGPTWPPVQWVPGGGGPFPGGKVRSGSGAGHSPHLVPRSWMSRSYTSSPSCASIGVLWDCLFFTVNVGIEIRGYFCIAISRLMIRSVLESGHIYTTDAYLILPGSGSEVRQDGWLL
jgi:hypothetical protein